MEKCTEKSIQGLNTTHPSSVTMMCQKNKNVLEIHKKNSHSSSLHGILITVKLFCSEQHISEQKSNKRCMANDYPHVSDHYKS